MDSECGRGRGRGRSRGRARGRAQGRAQEQGQMRPPGAQQAQNVRPPPILPPAPANNPWRLPPPLKDSPPTDKVVQQVDTMVTKSPISSGQEPASETSNRTRSRGGGHGNGAEAAAQHLQQPAAQHLQQPAAQHLQQPAAQQLQQPAAQQLQQPAAQHLQQPAAQQLQQPAAQQLQQPAAQHLQQPAAQQLQQPAAQQLQQLSLGETPQVRGREHRRQEGEEERNDFLVVTRPENMTNKRGTSGRQEDLLVNCFMLNQIDDHCLLYQYDVKFKPAVESKAVRIALVKSQHEIIGQISAFDGGMLFLPRALPNDPTVFNVIVTHNNQQVEVTIRLIKELPRTDPDCVQIMNIIFKRVLKLMGMQRIGRDYFNPQLGIDVPQHGLQIWPGYDARIRTFEHNTMLCMDLNHRILRQTTVLDKMYDIQQHNPNRFKDLCFKELGDQIVLTRYNNQTYRVDDIDWSQNPESTFETRNGPISFVQYYDQNHRQTIHELGQPLLVSKPKMKDVRAGRTGNILLVPELCYLTGLSEAMRKDFRMMKDIAEHTRINPHNRRVRLEAFSGQLMQQDNARKELANWGLSVSQRLARVPARVLNTEKILVGGGKDFTYRPLEADWGSQLRGQKLIRTPSMQNWALLYPPSCEEVVQGFKQTLANVAGPMDIGLGQPIVVRLNNHMNDTYVRALRQTINEELVIVVCIVPGFQKDRYDAIKKTCCINHPINSQVVVKRTLDKRQMLMSVCTKIALQMNSKIGGEAWTVAIPLQKTMICGMDTYHQRNSRSVGAFVASVNDRFTMYHSRAALFDEKQELHDHLRVMMTSSLKRYFEVNGFLPEKIIVYRDGVGDGQLDAVVKHEIPQIQEAFKTFQKPDGAPYKPYLSVVVVKKRISTRFFQQTQGQCKNPPPGTVVDDVVTNANWYDFFVISQSVRQGSVSPTHYNVIHNNMPPALTPDRMQQLTYKLCHLYVNWPGTIRVPAPCMYAHKLAYLVGDNLKAEPSPALANFLFYL